MWFGSFFFLNVLMFVDWFENLSANFVYVYEIYATGAFYSECINRTIVLTACSHSISLTTGPCGA